MPRRGHALPQHPHTDPKLATCQRRMHLRPKVIATGLDIINVAAPAAAIMIHVAARILDGTVMSTARNLAPDFNPNPLYTSAGLSILLHGLIPS